MGNELTRKSSRLTRSNSSTSVSTSISIQKTDKNILSRVSSFSNETDRLLSNQGLITPTKRSSTLSRKIRDKSYYKGLIHLKGREISNEISKLQKEVSLLSTDQSMYLPYKRKAESMAVELQNLQKTLANYNLADDMLNNDMQVHEAKEELQNLKEDNEKENADAEKLFDMIKLKEVIIKELTIDLSQESSVSEILGTTMNTPLCEKYTSLKKMEEKLKSARLKHEEILKKLNKERMSLENQCNENQHLDEVLILTKKLWQQEAQRDGLLLENKFSSELEESAYLQKYKTECSALLKGMMQEIRNLKTEITGVMNELKNVETGNCDLYRERIEKYSRLRKKEDVMEEFLSSFSNQQLVLMTERQQLHCKTVELLKQVSSKLKHVDSLLNSGTDSTYTETDKQEAELRRQYLKLTSDLNCLNDIEKKLEEECKLRKDEIALKEKEITSVSKIEDVKENMKCKEKELSKNLTEIKKQKYGWKFILEDLQKYHDHLKNKLSNNQTYITLSKLEKQWHSLEEENFSMENFIASSNADGRSYLLVKEEVKKLYSELNKIL